MLEVFEPALYGHAGVLLSPPSQLLTGICVAAPFVVVQRYKSMLSNWDRAWSLFKFVSGPLVPYHTLPFISSAWNNTYLVTEYVHCITSSVTTPWCDDFFSYILRRVEFLHPRPTDIIGALDGLSCRMITTFLLSIRILFLIYRKTKICPCNENFLWSMWVTIDGWWKARY